jgi:prepilin-type processing-associated H-X9-DG protein
MYGNSHQGDFPATLDDAVKWSNASPQVLVDPRQPERKPAFEYVKPPEGDKAPPERLVIYGAPTPFGDGAIVGFADGHVEWITDHNAFEKMLKEAKQAKDAHGKGTTGDATPAPTR